MGLPGVLPAYLPAAVALLLAGCGALLLRGRGAAWVPVVGAVAAAAGWALLAPSGRPGLWERGALEGLAIPALVVAAGAGASTVVRGRWAVVAAAVFGAWWVAGMGAARPEFWRVGFVVTVGAWVLHRAGAGQGRLAFGAASALWAGLVMAGSPAGPIGVALVLACAAAGVSVVGKAGVLPPALLAVGIGAADVGAGRLVRGGIGLADLVCLAAFAAALLGGWAERLARPRVGRAAVVLAPVLLAAGCVGAAWVVARVLRV